MTTSLVYASPYDAIEFNEVYRNFTGSAGYVACNNIYNRVVLNEWFEIKPFPDLATHWERLDGARRWRFHLNQAARWQDGAPLTAYDVAYTHTHAKIMDYTGAMFLQDVDSIEVINDHTVDYHLKSANSGFLVLLGNFIFSHILPKHLYEGTDWATNPHNLNPVGSGPFRLAEWLPGEHVVLEAVKNHWGPQPGVDRIVIKVVPDRDECVRMTARGEAHIIGQDTLTRDRLHLAHDLVDTELVVTQGPGMAVLDFNHGSPRWQDERARRAVASAIDRTEIAAEADPGVSQAWEHYLLGSTEWALDPNAKAPEFDPTLAGRLLDEAGMTADPDGRRGPLQLYYLELFFGHKRLAEIVARQLESVGFEVSVAGLQSVDWARRIRPGGDFDLFIIGGSMAPDPEITSTKFCSNGRENRAGHHNRDVDAAYQAAREATTVEERGRQYRNLQAVFARDVEWIPLFWYGIYTLRSTKFFGWSDQLDHSIPWWHWGRVRETGVGALGTDS